MTKRSLSIDGGSRRRVTLPRFLLSLQCLQRYLGAAGAGAGPEAAPAEPAAGLAHALSPGRVALVCRAALRALGDV